MEEATNSVKESVKNGQYFIDTKSWYLTKYINIFVERNIIACLMLFYAVILAVICVHYLMLNINKQVEYITKINDISRYYSTINPLGTILDNPQLMVEKFMVTEYVLKKENYNFEQLERQKDFISNHSSDSVFQNYQHYMSINNPNSPLLIFGQNIKKMVHITEIRPKDLQNNTFLVYFTAVTFQPGNNANEKNRLLAEVTYQMSSLKDLMEKNSKVLDFKVTSYSTTQLN